MTTENEKRSLAEGLQSVESQNEPGSRRFLYIAVCLANLTAFTCGETFGWTSPIIPKLSSNESCLNPLPEPVTLSQASWIGSLLPIGATLGPFIAGFILDKIGRKNTLLVTTVPMVVSYLIAAYAKSVMLFYLARLLAGLSVGAICTALPIYIAEVSEDAVRASLSTLMQLFIVVGILFSYAAGPYLTVTTFNIISGITPLIFLFVFYLYIPETPHFFIAQGKIKKAEKSLQKLRQRINVKEELNGIQYSVEESMKNKGTFSDIFKTPALKKAFIISSTLMALQQLSGINVIIFYAQTIFAATGQNIAPEIASMIIGVVQIIGSIMTPLIVDKKGKRFLLLFSAFFMGLSELILGAYFHFNMTIGWLPIFCLISYIIAYCLGFGPLPWAVLGEVFPADVKSIASTVVASWCWFLSFFITKYFGTVAELIGMGGSFWLFTACCFFGVFFVYKYLPDTTGKSLDEIQQILAGNRK